MKPLTARQAEILEFIRNYVKRLAYPPTIREIQEATGLASPSTVHKHLKALVAKGYIEIEADKPRTIRVIPHRKPHLKAVGE